MVVAADIQETMRPMELAEGTIVHLGLGLCIFQGSVLGHGSVTTARDIKIC